LVTTEIVLPNRFMSCIVGVNELVLLHLLDAQWIEAQDCTTLPWLILEIAHLHRIANVESRISRLSLNWFVHLQHVEVFRPN